MQIQPQTLTPPPGGNIENRQPPPPPPSKPVEESESVTENIDSSEKENKITEGSIDLYV